MEKLEAVTPLRLETSPQPPPLHTYLIVDVYLFACEAQLRTLKYLNTPSSQKMGYKRKTDPAVALEVERKLALAVAYYKTHTKSFRDVAIHFGVNKDTLYRRVKGTHKSYAESHASSQRLSTASEAALEQRIHEACDEWFPPTLKQVKEWAQKLVDEEYEKARKEGKVPRFSHADKLGVNWHFQFLGRHPEFRTRIQREMEKTQEIMELILDEHEVLDLYRRMQ